MQVEASVAPEALPCASPRPIEPACPALVPKPVGRAATALPPGGLPHSPQTAESSLRTRSWDPWQLGGAHTTVSWNPRPPAVL